MPGRLHELFSDVVSLESPGLALALALLVVLRLLLPSEERGLLRQPVSFLLLHAAARLAAAAVPMSSGVERALKIAAVLLLLAAIGRAGVLLLLDVVLGRRMLRPLPRIVRDIVQALVWVAILFVALRMFGVETGHIFTTSALLTAAIALSLQETLGNLIAGLAIQLQQPFDVGDWIQFDAEKTHIGRVIEINWRATKVLTLDLVEVIVPNATLAKAPIANFTKPTKISRRSLYAYAPADVPPHLVQETILAALDGSFGIVAEPAPSVVTNGFVDGNVEYWIRFFTDKFDKRDGVDGAARDRVWYALNRLGITPAAAPNRAVAMQDVAAAARARDEHALHERELALRNVDFLAVLPDAEQRRLAEKSTMRLYVDGEPIVEQGEHTAEMFVVHRGQVRVLVERADAPAMEVARLGPGKFFGEMALMTGEPRNATVRAAGACALLVIDDRALRAVLESTAGAAGHISRVIAERQAALAGQEAAHSTRQPTSVEERRDQLLGRIRKFFSL